MEDTKDDSELSKASSSDFCLVAFLGIMHWNYGLSLFGWGVWYQICGPQVSLVYSYVYQIRSLHKQPSKDMEEHGIQNI